MVPRTARSRYPTPVLPPIEERTGSLFVPYLAGRTGIRQTQTNRVSVRHQAGSGCGILIGVAGLVVALVFAVVVIGGLI